MSHEVDAEAQKDSLLIYCLPFVAYSTLGLTDYHG
jgi:hypothetical protein